MAKLAFAPSNETSPSLARIAASTRAPLARPVLAPHLPALRTHSPSRGLAPHPHPRPINLETSPCRKTLWPKQRTAR
ncbi:hypothetical protein BCEN4_660075 [Burkholderia cenocepacia]|nr:hypothetical protein BCEN4_660075 [Burkholderia cenocepacia]